MEYPPLTIGRDANAICKIGDGEGAHLDSAERLADTGRRGGPAITLSTAGPEERRLDLRLRTERTGRRTDLFVAGEIDLTTASRFGDALVDACMANPTLVVLDFAECSFMDSSGLRALLTFAKGPGADNNVKLGPLSDAITRLLTISGTLESFDRILTTACRKCGVDKAIGLVNCPRCETPPLA